MANDLGTAKGTLEVDTSQVVSAFKAAKNSGKEFFDETGKGSKLSESDIRGLGRQGVIMGSALFGGFGLAIKAGADFEKRMSAVKAVSRASGEEIEKLSDLAFKLGESTSFGAVEVAGSMEELVKAGLGVEDILNGAAAAAVSLAEAGEITLGESAVIAASAMNQFSLSASDLPRVADAIAGAANASSIEVHDFGLSIKQVGAVAALAGLSFDDTALAITAMGQAGIRGSDAGTSLKAFLQNLNPVTQKQIDLFRELGLASDENVTSMNDLGNAFFNADGSIKSMVEIADLLRESMSGLSQAQRTAALETIFGTDAIRAAGTFTNITSENLRELNDVLLNTDASQIAKDRLDNFTGSLKILKNTLETQMVQASEPFLKIFKRMTDLVIDAVRIFSQMPDALKSVALGITGLSGAFLISIGTLALMWPTIERSIKLLKLMALATKGFTASLLTNPIFLAIAAIVALGAAIWLAYKNIEGFRDFIDGKVVPVLKEIGRQGVQAFQWIKLKAVELYETIVSDVLPPILNALSNFWDSLVDFGTEAWASLAPILTAVGENYVAALMTVYDFIKDYVIPIAIEVGQWYIDTWSSIISFIINEVIPAMVDVAETIYEAFLGVNEFLEETVIPIFWEIYNGINDVISSISDAISEFVGFLTKSWDDAEKDTEPFLSWWDENVGPVIEGSLEIATLALEAFMTTNQWVWEAVQFAIAPVLPLFEAFGDYSVSNLPLAFQTLLDLISGIFTSIQIVIEIFVTSTKFAWDTFGDDLALISEGFLGILLTTVETVLGLITSAIDVFIGLVTFDFERLGDGVEGLWTGMLNGILEASDPVFKLIEGLVGGWLDLMETEVLAFAAIIEDIWNRLWGTVQSVTNRVWSEVSSKITGTLNNIRERVSNTLDNIRNTWNTVWGNVRNVTTSVFGTITGTVSTAMSRVANYVSTRASSAANAVSSAWKTVQSTTSSVWRTVRSTIESNISRAVNKITSAVNGIRSTWSSVWNGVAGVIQRVGGTIRSALSGIESKISSIASAASRLSNVVGTISGAASKIGGISGSIGGLIPKLAAGGIINAATLAIVGEAGPEAVIPMGDEARALDLMFASGLAEMLFRSTSLNPGAIRYTVPPASSGSTGGGIYSGDRKIEAVHIEEANFNSKVDFKDVLDEAEVVMAGMSFSDDL